MLKIAILDLYEGYANQGMRCIREIVYNFGDFHGLEVQLDEFEVRLRHEVPGTEYDIYISTGGPGSPLESEGSEWEKLYFGWYEQIVAFNNDPLNFPKKHVFFICHSFQLLCRYLQLGDVAKRKSTSFGVFPVHMLPGGENDVIFNGLHDPFYVVDSRDFQVISPDHRKIREMGAQILSIEKARPHVPLERAIMAIRFNEYFFGTQFHPEADPIGMRMYLQTEEKKQAVIEGHGEDKWKSMIEHLSDPDKIMYTQNIVLPNFLQQACEKMELAEWSA